MKSVEVPSQWGLQTSTYPENPIRWEIADRCFFVFRCFLTSRLFFFFFRFEMNIRRIFCGTLFFMPSAAGDVGVAAVSFTTVMRITPMVA